jgi:hypothetical protein
MSVLAVAQIGVTMKPDMVYAMLKIVASVIQAGEDKIAVL